MAGPPPPKLPAVGQFWVAVAFARDLSWSTHLQLAPCVRAALIVQTVGSFILWPSGLPLLQGRAPAPAASLLSLGPAGKQGRLGQAHVLTAPGKGAAQW